MEQLERKMMIGDLLLNPYYELRWKYLQQFNVSKLSRVMAGEICGFAARNEEKLRVNFQHYSKENIASVPSSYILPKGSPLEVGTNIRAQMTLGND